MSAKTALFTNFSDQEFIGYWNGKPKKFKSGESRYMPEYLAKHFAKHLSNKELQRKDDQGNPIYKDGEKYTSPKRPEDVPVFMDLFNKAYTPQEEQDDDVGEEGDDVDSLIQSVNSNKEDKRHIEHTQESENDEDSDTEESFIGKPQDDDVGDNDLDEDK